MQTIFSQSRSPRGNNGPTLNQDLVLYCIVLYCIVLYCIVLYCIVLYCIVSYRIGDKDHIYALLNTKSIGSTMFVQKSFKFSITAISLSYDICSAFQNLQHFTIVGNSLYAKIKSNE